MARKFNSEALSAFAPVRATFAPGSTIAVTRIHTCFDVVYEPGSVIPPGALGPYFNGFIADGYVRLAFDDSPIESAPADSVPVPEDVYASAA